jgi:ketosteroid isomerase-like protein
MMTMTSTNTTSANSLVQNATPTEYLAVVDALHRFAWGMDTDDGALIASAFAPTGTADFSPAAQKLGIQFPAIEGRENIAGALGAFAGMLVTSHSISNVRVQVNGDSANLRALVDAQHFPEKDTSRSLLLKNDYDVALIRDGDGWLIARMTISNIWSQGDIDVITGQ